MFDDGQVLELPSLLEDAEGWYDLTIPDATPPVRLLRLHVDQASRANVSLVAFPAGWARPGLGHYRSGEEFVVLRGSLTVSGREHRAGGWAWIPPFVTRSDSYSTGGALALAWFSGPARWFSVVGDESATSQAAADVPQAGPLRRRCGGVPGESEVLPLAPTEPAATDRDLLSLPDQRWTFVSAHHPPPQLSGPVLVRHWS